MSDQWRKLWEFRGEKYKEKSLIVINGFDSGAGKMSKKALKEIIMVIREKLAITCSDKILEVGCGSGMILKPIRKLCYRVAGVDFADSLIAKIRQVIPDGEFKCSEAINLPFDDNTFDKTLSFSVFHYFPTYSYAKGVLNEMIRCTKNNGRIFIGDIPDLAMKKVSEETRKQCIIHKDFKDQGLRHLYYTKAFFRRFFEDQGMKYEIFNYAVKGYKNSEFRFNVLAYIQK